MSTHGQKVIIDFLLIFTFRLLTAYNMYRKFACDCGLPKDSSDNLYFALDDIIWPSMKKFHLTVLLL